MTEKHPKKLCEEEKVKGNAEYKVKNFKNALKHYNAALEHDPTNIPVMNNMAAVYIDQKKYEDCIKLCGNALEIGQKNRADRVTMAKTYYRMAKAYEKQDDLENSLKYYDFSIIVNRNPSLIKIAQKMELDLENRQRKAYLDPDISQQEKLKGDQFFKDKDYDRTLEHYNEAIKRNPDNIKLYFNRALCYQKLKEYTLSLEDAETCIRMDSSYLQAYIIKGWLFRKLKAPKKAQRVFEKAIAIDGNCKEAFEGLKLSIIEARTDPTDPEAVQERIQRDPELKAILSEPEISRVLYDMEKNPDAMASYLKDPSIRKKLNRLIECGLLSIN